MVTARAANNRKNIWVAAGDGDLERVQELVLGGVSPNIADENSYTPMHAAASYAQVQVLDFLISSGGDVNVKDDDGETPLYAVESVDMARYLTEKGAAYDLQNDDGETPADKLEEDFPEVAAYIRSLGSPGPPDAVPTSSPSQPSRSIQPSQFVAEQAAEHLTTGLMDQIQGIMEQADRDGVDPQEALQRVLGDAFLASAQAGRNLTEPNPSGQVDEGGGSKRPRLNPDGPER